MRGRRHDGGVVHRPKGHISSDLSELPGSAHDRESVVLGLKPDGARELYSVPISPDERSLAPAAEGG
jgi:hypothetical protein